MHTAWGSLGIVFVVSFGAAVTVVVLVAFALVAVFARATHQGDAQSRLRRSAAWVSWVK